jgi:hypothetical protein
LGAAPSNFTLPATLPAVAESTGAAAGAFAAGADAGASSSFLLQPANAKAQARAVQTKGKRNLMRIVSSLFGLINHVKF